LAKDRRCIHRRFAATLTGACIPALIESDYDRKDRRWIIDDVHVRTAFEIDNPKFVSGIQRAVLIQVRDVSERGRTGDLNPRHIGAARRASFYRVEPSPFQSYFEFPNDRLSFKDRVGPVQGEDGKGR
jgi:hypothetical protein